MAKINCRYTIPYCEYNGRHEPLHHSEYWFCDSNDECDIGKYEKPWRRSGEVPVANPICRYCAHYHGEFEKVVKSYEYGEAEGVLKIGRTQYDEYEIEFLKIDGRILIGKENEP